MTAAEKSRVLARAEEIDRGIDARRLAQRARIVTRMMYRDMSDAVWSAYIAAMYVAERHDESATPWTDAIDQVTGENEPPDREDIAARAMLGYEENGSQS